ADGGNCDEAEMLHLHTAKASLSWPLARASVAAQHYRLTPGRHKISPAAAAFAARQDEGIERFQVGIHLVDLALQTLDLGRDDAQRRPVARLGFGRAKIGA